MLSIVEIIRLFQKRLSFTNAYFATTRLYTNMEPDLSNVVVFNLIEQNGSRVDDSMKRKKLSAQPDITT